MLSVVLCRRQALTFLSGDFMAKTDMCEASSGQHPWVITFPSSSPQNQPGEFSSPKMLTTALKCFQKVMVLNKRMIQVALIAWYYY